TLGGAAVVRSIAVAGRQLVGLCYIDYPGMSFFFSSRRRHTRFSRDWSSDVCSSDLSHSKWLAGYYGNSYALIADAIESSADVVRSEERRVGKERRYRWQLSDSYLRPT